MLVKLHFFVPNNKKKLAILKPLQKRFENILIQYLQIVEVWTVT